jgi:hypothetical protein
MLNHQSQEIHIQYRVNPPVTNDELNELFAASWQNHSWRDFAPVLRQSLAYVGAYVSECLTCAGRELVRIWLNTPPPQPKNAALNGFTLITSRTCGNSTGSVAFNTRRQGLDD